MANNVQVSGDPNVDQGDIETPLQNFVFASGLLVSVNGTPVTDDNDDETGVVTANGSSFVKISGIPVNFFGNADTSGDPRAGTQILWVIIQL
jgi:uncharacterized Zn-binding protein involved in type VI secretion